MRSLITVVALALLVACKGSDSTTAPVTAVGSWNLSTINGSPMPFLVIGSGTNKSEVTGGNLTVSSGGSFTSTIAIRNTINGTVTTQAQADAGTYTTNGTAITFKLNSDGSLNTGSFTSNSLTISASGFSYIFTR